MASINDTAGIFVGPVLEAFNQMEAVVARDGDVAYAQKEMLAAMQTAIQGTGGPSGGPTGRVVRPRP